jgi:hypothetical protein
MMMNDLFTLRPATSLAISILIASSGREGALPPTLARGAWSERRSGAAGAAT